MDELPIGDFAARAGLTVDAVRFYEERGLVSSTRTAGNQRRFRRAELRRLAVVAAGRRIGLTLDELAAALAELPAGRVPTHEDWERFAVGWRARVDERIAELRALRDDLTGCIGCGCLSTSRCALFNAGDAAAAEGPGSRWLRAAAPPPADDHGPQDTAVRRVPRTGP